MDLRSGGWTICPKPVMFFNFQTDCIAHAGEIEGEVYPSPPDFYLSPDGRRMLYGIERVSNTDIRTPDPFQ